MLLEEVSSSESQFPHMGAAASHRGASGDQRGSMCRAPPTCHLPAPLRYCPSHSCWRLTFPVSPYQRTRKKRPPAACGYTCGHWMGQACPNLTPWTYEELSLHLPPHPPHRPPRPPQPRRPLQLQSQGPLDPPHPPLRHPHPLGGPQQRRPSLSSGCWTPIGDRAPCCPTGRSSRAC